MSHISFYMLVVLLVGCGEENSTPRRSEWSKDTVSVSAVDPEASTTKPLTYEQRQGRHLFMKYCAVCHGEGGTGDGFNAFNLNPKPRDFTDAKYMNALSDGQLVETISQGGKGVNKSAFMPAWGGRLTKNEQEYVITFLRTLATNAVSNK